MQVNRVIQTLLDSRPDSGRSVSAALGRSSSYVRVVAQPSRSPALATVVDVADVLGYDLAIIDRKSGKALGTIQPPRRSGADPIEGSASGGEQ